MAQTAGVLCGATAAWRRKMLLAKVESAEFLRPIRSGDRLELSADLLEERIGTYRLRTEARSEGSLAARAWLLLQGIDLDSEAGRVFDNEVFRRARAESLRALGVDEFVEIPTASA